jgi:hypothetical protein
MTHSSGLLGGGVGKRSGLQIFLVAIYQNGVKNIPNDHKICQHLPLQCPPKFTQIGIFGLKIYRLATLKKIPERSLVEWSNGIVSTWEPAGREIEDRAQDGI